MSSPHPAAGRIPVVEVVVPQELDLPGLSRLNRMLDEALALQPVVLVVDVEHCPVMDAAAIEVLIEAHRRARRDGGLLTLRAPSARLRRNLRLARADRVLHVTPGPDDTSSDGTLPDEASQDEPSADGTSRGPHDAGHSPPGRSGDRTGTSR